MINTPWLDKWIVPGQGSEVIDGILSKIYFLFDVISDLTEAIKGKGKVVPVLN
jgi:hypothetical protein